MPFPYTLLLLLSLFVPGIHRDNGTNPSERSGNQPGGWVVLYNGKDLTGWDRYLGPPLDDSGKALSPTPVGLNNDPQGIFGTVKQNGETLIRISGEGWGAISTKQEYADYHLQLQFKWGLAKWGQKKNKKRDSGLLYHSVGPFGADGTWMRSQEFQVQEGDTGDYWGVAGGEQDVSVTRVDSANYVYDPNGQLLPFSANSPYGRHCNKRGNPEHPSGEWNTLDLYCHGDTSVHVVNGQVVMVLYHSRQLDNGKETSLVKGKIQLQSEGAEVYYRKIRIKALEGIPRELLK